MDTSPNRKLNWEPEKLLLLIKLLKITPENGWFNGHHPDLTSEDRTLIARIINGTFNTPFARLIVARHEEIPIYLDRTLALSLVMGCLEELLKNSLEDGGRNCEH